MFDDAHAYMDHEYSGAPLPEGFALHRDGENERVVDRIAAHIVTNGKLAEAGKEPEMAVRTAKEPDEALGGTTAQESAPPKRVKGPVMDARIQSHFDRMKAAVQGKLFDDE